MWKWACASYGRSMDELKISLSSPSAEGAGATTNKCEKRRRYPECSNPFSLTCITRPDCSGSHGETIKLRCKRWRLCPGCALRLGWELQKRFGEGIRQAPRPDLHAMFFTLTFPHDASEDDAHAALRSLVARLRYRELLTEFGWVLQRGKPSAHSKLGHLHYHGVAWMPWMSDDLKQWRDLLARSGFGRNQLVIAEPRHAAYISRYVSARLADLSRCRRAYGFSKNFPQTPWVAEQRRIAEVGRAIGLTPECQWVPSYLLDA